ncbi:MAG: L,D-transpeptidase family protein [Paracoccaceae bacterium]|nr:L,D-transpeptidase family protein [Paracoccaceae bacterium]
MRALRATLLSSLLVSLIVGGLLYARFVAITPRPPVPLTAPIDRILIEKAARRMTLYRDGVPLRVYRVSLGFQPEGDKERQGDGRTPEGSFRVDRKNAQSRFYLSLGIDYPQAEDLVRASTAGVSPGGDIFIHGQPRGVYGRQRIARDWTAGCIAVSNMVMDELWKVVGIGTEVEIRP